MQELVLLSAGAAASLVKDMASAFESDNSCRINGTFSAVGEIKEKFLSSEVCDVLILSEQRMNELDSADFLLSDTISLLGYVPTGLAVKEGVQVSQKIDDIDSAKKFFLDSSQLYIPNSQYATAGIHVVKILKEMGLYEQVEARIREFKNGATAMSNLSKTDEQGAIGCTQATEIIATPNIRFLGPLPESIGLRTPYVIAIPKKHNDRKLAFRFLQSINDLSIQQKEARGFLL